MDAEHREEIVESEHQSAFHFLFSVRFCGKSNDGSRTEMRYKEFDDDEEQQGNNEREEHGEGHRVINHDFDVEESCLSVLKEIFVAEVNLVNEQLYIQQCFKDRRGERPPTNEDFFGGDGPSFGNYFSRRHFEGRRDCNGV